MDIEKVMNQIYSILKENPYQMAEDIAGVGFKTADEIASRIGIRTDSDFRIRSGIIYVLLQIYIEKNKQNKAPRHLALVLFVL